MHGKRTDYTKCPTAVFQIKGLTFVPLHTPNSYILLPEKPITIQLFCKLNTKHTITQPIIIKSNEDCIVFFDQNVMKIGGITRETNISSSPYNIFVNYTEEELRIINDKIPIILKISPNFKSYETSLNDTDQ